METTHNSVKVKLGIKVMKLVESLIGREVSDAQQVPNQAKAKRDDVKNQQTYNFCWFKFITWAKLQFHLIQDHNMGNLLCLFASNK